MLLTKSLFICFATVTLCLAGTTLGNAVVQELVSEDEEILGQSIVNYAGNSDQTECIVICWDLEPEAEYTVFLCDSDEYGRVTDSCMLGNLTTNKVGNGCLFTLVDGDTSDWCVIVGYELDGKLSPLAISIGDLLDFRDIKLWLDLHK